MHTVKWFQVFLTSIILFNDNNHLFTYYYTGSLDWRVERSPMVRETWVQSQVASYQGLLKWYLIPPCLTLSDIRYVLRVKWSNPAKGVAPSPTPRCSSYWKGSLQGRLQLKGDNFTYFTWYNVFITHLYVFKYSFVILIIRNQLYGFKGMLYDRKRSLLIHRTYKIMIATSAHESLHRMLSVLRLSSKWKTVLLCIGSAHSEMSIKFVKN